MPPRGWIGASRKPPEGKAAARMAQELLGPEVRVVSAFQNIPASALVRPDKSWKAMCWSAAMTRGARAEVVRLAEGGRDGCL